MYVELGDMLTALTSSITPALETNLYVTEAELEIPLEVMTGIRHGQLVFFATPPMTQWKTGVMPTVHMARLTLTIYDENLNMMGI